MEFLNRFRGKSPPDNVERIENRSLLNAMASVARNDSPENRARLYSTLQDVILIIPIAEIPAGAKPGPFVTTGNESFQFPILRDTQGIKLLPVFTDVEALRNWDANTPYVGLKSLDLFKAVLGTDADQIRINPYDPIRKMIKPGGTLTRHEFQILAEGRIPSQPGGSLETIELHAGQQILIGVPAQGPSHELVAALVSTAQSVDNINALYLFQIAWQQNQKWNFQKVIGVQLIEDLHPQKDELIRKLAQSIQPLLPQGEFLDFMLLTGAMEQQVMAHGKLLYQVPNNTGS